MKKTANEQAAVKAQNMAAHCAEMAHSVESTYLRKSYQELASEYAACARYYMNKSL